MAYQFPDEGGGGGGYGGGSPSPVPGFGSYGGLGGGFNPASFYAPLSRMQPRFPDYPDVGAFGGGGGVGYTGAGPTAPTQPATPMPGAGGRFGRPIIGYPTTQPTGAQWGRRREDAMFAGGGGGGYGAGLSAIGNGYGAGGGGGYGGGGVGQPAAPDYSPPPASGNWMPGEGDFRLQQFQRLNAFDRAGYFDPRGNRMLIEAGRMNAANVSRAMQEQQRVASQIYRLDPAQTASGVFESGIRGQGSEADAINNALMQAYYRQADLANQMQLQAAGSGARRERTPRPSPWGAALGAAGTIGGALLGGPVGAAIGGSIGGFFGGGAPSYGGGYDNGGDYYPGAIGGWDPSGSNLPPSPDPFDPRYR